MLDLLHESIGSGEAGEVLGSKALVYPLFAAVYDLSFDLKSNLTKKTAAKISKAKISELGERALKALDGRAPKRIQVAVEARASQSKNRRSIVKYLVAS